MKRQHSLFVLFLSLHFLSLSWAQECPAVSVTNEWPGGYQAQLAIPFDHEVHGWEMVLGFDTALDTFEVHTMSLSERKSLGLWCINQLTREFGASNLNEVFSLPNEIINPLKLNLK